MVTILGRNSISRKVYEAKKKKEIEGTTAGGKCRGFHLKDFSQSIISLKNQTTMFFT